MLSATPRAVRDSLRRLRARGEPVALADLARQLLCLDAPPPPPLARRLVGGALGCEPGSLPERLEPHRLRAPEEAALAHLRLSRAAFAVVDLETTGFAPAGASILELAAVRVAGLAARERFATLVRPRGALPRAITQLTGIDRAALAGAPPPRRALASFRRWLEQRAPFGFVAHNASFDAGFLARAFAAFRLPVLRAPVLCTRMLARRVLPRLGRYDLDHVCAHLGIENRARHRAAGDAAATAQVLVELLERARTELGVETLGDLFDLQERPPARRRR